MHRTSAGRIRAMSCATKLPIEYPRRSIRSRSIAVKNAMASLAISAMVLGVVPLEPPTPALSKRISRRRAARASTSGGSQ